MRPVVGRRQDDLQDGIIINVMNAKVQMRPSASFLVQKFVNCLIIFVSALNEPLRECWRRALLLACQQREQACTLSRGVRPSGSASRQDLASQHGTECSVKGLLGIHAMRPNEL